MASKQKAMEVDTNEKVEEKPKEAEVKLFTAADLQEEINEISKATTTLPVSRVLRRFFTTTRKQLNKEVLQQALSKNFTTSTKFGDELQSAVSKLPQSSQSDKMEVQTSTSTPQAEIITELTPEVEIYLGLLVTVALIDNKLYPEATIVSSALVHRLQEFNRRTLNPLSAKVYAYFSRSFELVDRLAEIRPALLAAHRTASLRMDDETHVTLLNLLLRNYLHYNLYDQADKLQSKTTLKEDATSSNQLARYKYYQGRIKAIQLNYTGADADLQEALRKAPQNSARGFRITVHKFACIVELLMGEIPERSIFRQKGMKSVLAPYLKLAQAVRVGDLNAFHEVVKQFGDTFRKDKTFTLIQRLRHNVIKTGLRKINLSYSRISIADICSKLHLDSVADAEFIVSKAIRDGVIEATIDHEQGWIRSKETSDVYATSEPLDQFSERIKYCLKVHNDAVKAMRYAEGVKPGSSVEEEDLEERKKQEKELEDKLVDDDDDDEL